MRVAFAGSPEPAVNVLDALHSSDHEVALVVSQPDRRRGRRGRPTATPVAARAEQLGIATIRPASINNEEALGALRAARIDALCVAAFGQLLRDDVLDGWPCINVHFSVLPEYRGAAPVERAIIDGRERSGVTIMQMDAGLDTGPILAVDELDIGSDESGGALLMRMAGVGGELLVETLHGLAAGSVVPRAQPDEGATLAPRIVDDDRRIDPADTAHAIANRVRALSPHVGVRIAIDGEPFKLWKVAALVGESTSGLERRGDRLLLGCSDGAVEIIELQPPGKQRMGCAPFLRGWRGALELTEL